MFIEVDEDFDNHPKTIRLRTALQNSLAGYYVIRLWAWCTKYQKDGDLSGYQPEEVEAAVGWTLDAGKLYASLVAVGFIEIATGKGARVHDWYEHQGKWIRRLEADRQAARERRAGRRREDRDDPPPTLHDLAEHDKQESLPTVVGPSADVVRASSTAKPSLAKQSKIGSDSSEVLSDSEPALLRFPVVGGKDGPGEWPFTKATLEYFKFSFPDLDVLAEMRKALSWVTANPRRRKTRKGMAAFVHNWLSRATDRGGGARSPNGAAPPKQQTSPGLCGFHVEARNANRPARKHDPACSECRHVAAIRSGREGGIETVGALIASDDPLPAWAGGPK